MSKTVAHRCLVFNVHTICHLFCVRFSLFACLFCTLLIFRLLTCRIGAVCVCVYVCDRLLSFLFYFSSASLYLFVCYLQRASHRIDVASFFSKSFRNFNNDNFLFRFSSASGAWMLECIAPCLVCVCVRECLIFHHFIALTPRSFLFISIFTEKDVFLFVLSLSMPALVSVEHFDCILQCNHLSVVIIFCDRCKNKIRRMRKKIKRNLSIVAHADEWRKEWKKKKKK